MTESLGPKPTRLQLELLKRIAEPKRGSEEMNTAELARHAWVHGWEHGFMTAALIALLAYLIRSLK